MHLRNGRDHREILMRPFLTDPTQGETGWTCFIDGGRDGQWADEDLAAKRRGQVKCLVKYQKRISKSLTH
jgi:hypothetical protein